MRPLMPSPSHCRRLPRPERDGSRASPRRCAAARAGAGGDFIDFGALIMDDEAVEGHPDAGGGRGADRRRAERLPGHAAAVQARYRREHRRRRFPVALRPGRGVQGNGPAGRGHRRIPEGAALARGPAQDHRSARERLLREGPVRHRGGDSQARGREPRRHRRRADRPDLLAGPVAGGAGQGGAGDHDLRAGPGRRHRLPGCRRSYEEARPRRTS